MRSEKHSEDWGDEMNRIIIYGAGKMFRNNIDKIDFSEVVCIADQALFLTPIYGCEVIRKDRIPEFEFDYIVVFNKWHMKEIRDDLIQLGIPENKILHWVYYVYIMKYRVNSLSVEILPFVSDFFRKHKNTTVLDINAGIVRNCLNTMHRDGISDIGSIELYSQIDLNVADSGTYRKILTELGTSRYDVIMCLDYFMNHTYDEWKDLYHDTYEMSRYMFVSVPYQGFNPSDSSWDEFSVKDGYIVSKAGYDMVMVYLIDKLQPDDDLHIYVASHKRFNTPKDPMYVPVYVGKHDDISEGALSDSLGDNIAELNPMINECTALYYIWKNTNGKYIGLNHYRRYFTVLGKPGIENIIGYRDVYEDLSRYDMIVAPAYFSYPYSLRKQIEVSVNHDAYETTYKVIRDLIADRHPDYLNDFDIYFAGSMMYPCNMFITNRDILNRYCEWLFSIIIDACHKIDLSRYDNYSSRMIGFMAERLLTLWIIHNDIRVKEIEMVQIED